MSENEEEKPKQEFWSNNPNHKDYTTEGAKKSWAFYLTHRGKPKGQSPEGHSPEGHSPEGQSPGQSPKEKNAHNGMSDIKGKHIPTFHGGGHNDLHVDSYSDDGSVDDGSVNDGSVGASGDNGNDDDEERKAADREKCLGQYPGDVEAQKDYDRAVAEGKDPVKAVKDGVARRKEPQTQESQTQGSMTQNGHDQKEIKMKVILGKPNTRGNSDVVDNFDSEKLVSAGTVVKRTGEDTVAVFDGTGIPIGVAGYRQIEGQSRMAVNINGLGIGALLANPAEEITVGSQVYVTNEGKVTGVSKDNTALRAVFASGKGDGVDVLSNIKVPGGAVRIDMLGI